MIFEGRLPCYLPNNVGIVIQKRVKQLPLSRGVSESMTPSKQSGQEGSLALQDEAHGLCQ